MSFATKEKKCDFNNCIRLEIIMGLTTCRNFLVIFSFNETLTFVAALQLF